MTCKGCGGVQPIELLRSKVFAIDKKVSYRLVFTCGNEIQKLNLTEYALCDGTDEYLERNLREITDTYEKKGIKWN